MMSPKDKENLRKNRLSLVRGVVTNEDLLSFLMGKLILTDAMKEEIDAVSDLNFNINID